MLVTALQGVLPILPTIFTEAGAIDENGIRRVLDYIVAAGASGLVFPGLASEADMLSREERLHLSAQIGGWLAGRLPFIVGASADDPEACFAFAEAGAAAGAICAMILTPRPLATDNPALIRFYTEAHARCGLPIMLQNAPAPMGVGMALEDVAELARQVEGVRSVKEEAPPSGQRITRLVELAGPALDAVYGGAGARNVIDELVRGARGTMPAAEIVELHVAMLQSFATGAVQEARNLYERTLPLLTMQANFRWRLTKAVLQRRGLIGSSFTRAPGPVLDRHDEAELDALLARLADILPLDQVPGTSPA